MTDTETDEITVNGQDMLTFGWAFLCLFLAGFTLGYIKMNQVGPRGFWASDVCPDPSVICGNIPLAFPTVVFGTAGVFVAGRYMINNYGDKL